MRQPRPPLFPPLRRLGDHQACCLSRPVLGTTLVRECPWHSRSISELAEFPFGAHHSCSSSVGNGPSFVATFCGSDNASQGRRPLALIYSTWRASHDGLRWPPARPRPIRLQAPNPDDGRGHTRSPPNWPDFAYSSRRWAGVGTGTLENARI